MSSGKHTQPLNVGIDIGSVSVNLALVTGEGEVVKDYYVRTYGKPLETTFKLLEEVESEVGRHNLTRMAFTGTGARTLAELLGTSFVNEIVAQARAEEALHPEVRTIIEIGGEDSKLIVLKPDQQTGKLAIEDFAMNTLCAAGTGSFLDQQAHRLRLSIEDEFGQLALKCQTPPRMAGRCSVFAKTDMIHLQQQATPDYDIVAGLCYALARNLKSNLAKGRDLEKPIAFQGGVAANQGVVRAFKDVLELAEGELIIPEYHASMGAIGAVLTIMDTGQDSPYPGAEAVEAVSKRTSTETHRLPPLAFHKGARNRHYSSMMRELPDGPAKKVPAYLGVDVGSISTNVVAIDEEKRLLAKSYLMTAGRPLEAVKQGLREVGELVGDKIEVKGVGTTGSGRYLTGDFVGADVVRNEITSQATASALIDSSVDTIFEIGGQDSKYISLAGGVVVDFDMNHACAAGTGSFLEEQAEKLDISIKEEFGNLALSSKNPVKLGQRCTVFMESDLLHHQQHGAGTAELVAGLAYSIVHNYLNLVVGKRRIGDNIFFQGGVAANQGVVAAFEQVTGKPVTVPPHYEVTGAIGCAVLAMEFVEQQAPGYKSKFRGFDLAERRYQLRSFECDGCPNNCEVKEVIIEGEEPLYYGSRCDKWNLKDRQKQESRVPDLFAEREHFLLADYLGDEKPPATKGRVGLPRALFYYEMLPFWRTFFQALGYEVVLSPRTNKSIISKGVEVVAAETCFPVKVMHGHVRELLTKDLDFIFLPSIINLQADFENQEKNAVCPYVQTIPYQVRAALDFPKDGPELLMLPLHFQRGLKVVTRELFPLTHNLKVSKSNIRQAVKLAACAWQSFAQKCQSRGQEILSKLTREDNAMVVISRPYNGCDRGLNLDLPKKLRDLEVLAIPIDFLSLAEVDISDDWDNMYWKYGQLILSAARQVRDNNLLNAVYISNFSCGPDSFLATFFRKVMGDKPALLLEIDEHSADAGIITRCEAFLDSVRNTSVARTPRLPVFRSPIVQGDGRVLWIPRMAEHAVVVAAAFRAHGMAAEALPPTDEESLEIGRRFTTGKECLPAVVTAGDMVKKIQEPGFDPERAAFFMPSGTGPCRFGNYNKLHRLVLEEVGHPEIPIVSPNQGKQFYQDFAHMKSDPSRLAWQGIIATDGFYKVLHATRPYELEPGATDRVFRESIERLKRAMESQGDILQAVKESAEAFARIPKDTSRRKPLIGVVGEIFVRFHLFSNNNVIRQLEALGAETDLASFGEWIFYSNWTRLRESKELRDIRSLLTNRITNAFQRHTEKRLKAPLQPLCHHLIEPPISEVLTLGNQYLDDSFEGEAILSVGKTLEFYHQHASGVVNVMPFTCMPGTVVAAMLKKLREDHGLFPIVSVAYDGQQEAGTLTRLEAFMHQAHEYQAHKRL